MIVKLPPTQDIKESSKSASAIMKDYGRKMYIFFKDKKNDSRMMIFFALISTALTVYFLIAVIGRLNDLRQRIPQLQNLASYDTRNLETNTFTRNAMRNITTIRELNEENILTQNDINSYQVYLARFQKPYKELLQYIYLPSLNIWKDPFTKTINPNLIGIEYLTKNPYDDIVLIQKRSDFFKNVGENNESNEVSDISIGDIKENDKGFFSMPITVSFVANSRRAFLLLLDKLSMTSNRENIALMNEFFYYLREEIKKEKSKEIKDLEKTYATLTGFSDDGDMTDKVIAYHLYNWIFNDKDNILIDNKIITQTVKNSVICSNQTDEVCYYRFREKYRNIPTFGYLIGMDFATDAAKSFKNFVKALPPIFSIGEFSFDNLKDQVFTSNQNAKYKGKVTIEVYGRGMGASEISEIAKILGKKCFQNDKELSLEDAIARVSEAITELSDFSRINKSQSNDLRELKANFEKIQSEYFSYASYKKAIRLFETYRMLDEAGLCE